MHLDGGRSAGCCLVFIRARGDERGRPKPAPRHADSSVPSTHPLTLYVTNGQHRTTHSIDRTGAHCRLPLQSSGVAVNAECLDVFQQLKLGKSKSRAPCSSTYLAHVGCSCA